MKLQYIRAHAQSPYAKQWRSRALVIDRFGCLLFIVPAREPGEKFPEPLEVRDAEGEDFEETFGRFLPGRKAS